MRALGIAKRSKEIMPRDPLPWTETVQHGDVVLCLARGRRTFSDRRKCYYLTIESVSIKFETARSFYAI